MPIYIPDKWQNQTTCGGCRILPDLSQAFMETYTAITYVPDMKNASITIEFEGVAIYVYFILPNKQSPKVTAYSAANFTIDGEIVGNFSHSPDLSTTEILYKQMVFNKTDLPNGTHQLVVSTTLVDMHVFVNFDYAIYTQVTDDSVSKGVYSSVSSFTATSDTPVSGSGSGIASTTDALGGALIGGATSTGSPTGSDSQDSGSSKSRHTTVAIIGATIGGIILTGAATALFVWRRLGKRKINIGVLASSRFPWRKAPTRVQSPFLELAASTDYNHRHTSCETIGVPDEARRLFSRSETILNNFATMQRTIFRNYFKRLGRNGIAEPPAPNLPKVLKKALSAGSPNTLQILLNSQLDNTFPTIPSSRSHDWSRTIYKPFNDNDRNTSWAEEALVKWKGKGGEMDVLELNYTIDDGFGDSLTKKMPIYIPDEWQNQTTCGDCTIRPDLSQAFMATYTAITYYPYMKNASITIEFEGIAIYVFFILPNKQHPGTTTYSAASFTIDGQIVGNFSHSPDLSTTEILYNQMVFKKTDLPNGTHQLVVSTTLTDMNTWVNFDYAIYTQVTDDSVSTGVYSSVSSFTVTSDTPVSGSGSGIADSQNSGPPKSRHKTAAIIGATIGGVILVGAATALIVWRRLGKQKINIGVLTSSRFPWRRARTRVQSPFLELAAFTDYNHRHTSRKTIGVPDKARHLYSRSETILNDLTVLEHTIQVIHNYFKRLVRSDTAESRPRHASIHKARLSPSA
ncbi:hypothetical protein BDQ17DRAFT_1425684 [Cyathus striatus]|nr:hypothetical protein BDQ17DRAFT_1425684 [Cyathus striatus]